jgi:ubiquinone/menaquinone biosynthesis C-methylase UbiE
MIERARGKAQKMGWKNARFERSDIHDYSAPTKVDAVVFSLALSAMPDAPGCLEKARAMLEPGGQLVILDSFPQPSKPVANFFVHMKAPLVGAVPTRDALDFLSQRMEDVREISLSGGVYTVVSARKPLAGAAEAPSSLA